jgi:hypothetical protein
MVILLLLSLLFGGDDARMMALLDHAKEPIKATVNDASRRGDLLDILKRAEQSTRAFEGERKKIANEYARLQKKAEVTDEALQGVLEQMDTATVAFQQAMIRHRFDLRAAMTREEWERIYARPVEDGAAPDHR